jgi:hypothetical protein
MTDDPIVDEIHKVRELLLRECEGDLDKLIDRLQARERDDSRFVVDSLAAGKAFAHT